MDYNDKNNKYRPDDYADDPVYRRSRSGSGQKKKQNPPKKSKPQEPTPQPASAREGKKQEVSPLSKRLEKRAKKTKRKKVYKRAGIALLILMIIGIIVGSGIFVGMYAAVSTEIRDMNIDNLALNYSSFIYYIDENGQEQQLEKINSVNNRIWVGSDQIGKNVKDATVAIEDQRFYTHHGIDFKRTVGATVKYALSKIGIGSASYGGSTITQQVVKNITNEKDKTATRKIKEMMRAVALEKELSKEQILTMYLNIVYFANGCYGIEAASNTYFNKSADELTLNEAAAVVGIFQTPSKFDPYVNPDNTVEKRNTVLGKMLELNMISQEEHNEAAGASLQVVKKKNNGNNEISSYFGDQIMNDVVNDLQTQKGYSKDFAEQQVSSGGLKIIATIDPDIQDAIEKVFTNTANFPNAQAQAAMMVVDPNTGAIKGLVGGIGKKTESRGWNRATQATRQPGSAIKPLSAYAPALETGKIDESTVIKDEEITIGNDNWKPKNSYSGFKGDMLVKEAVERSSNIPAVKVVDMIGLSTSYNYLESKFRFTTLKESDKNYSSLALGGLTKGMSVREMAGAYGVFANGGKYIRPYVYSKVTDSAGRVILENKASYTQAVSPATAFIMSDLLYEVVNGSNGTGKAAKLDNIPTYGKTGTTNDNYDKWFVGYTPYYVGAIWYGYDKPQSLGSSNPTPGLWNKVMEQVHKGLSEKELEKPSNVVSQKICTISGNIAKSGCPSTTAYYISGKQPKKICSSHKPISSSNSSGNSSKSTAKPKTTKRPDSGEDDPDSTSEPSEATTTPSKATQAPAKATRAPSQEEPSGGDREPPASGGDSGNTEPKATAIPQKQAEE